MNQKLRSWIPTALFWILFAASLGFGSRYPWLDTIWYGALVLVLLVLSAYSLIHYFRHRHETDSISCPAVPHWLRRFFFDEHEEDPKAGRRVWGQPPRLSVERGSTRPRVDYLHSVSENT